MRIGKRANERNRMNERINEKWKTKKKTRKHGREEEEKCPRIVNNHINFFLLLYFRYSSIPLCFRISVCRFDRSLSVGKLIPCSCAALCVCVCVCANSLAMKIFINMRAHACMRARVRTFRLRYAHIQCNGIVLYMYESQVHLLYSKR